MELATTVGYRQLLEQISNTYRQGQIQAVQAVNAQLIETYWRVGQHIVEFEQGAKPVPSMERRSSQSLPKT
jgi:hypothetical protein